MCVQNTAYGFSSIDLFIWYKDIFVILLSGFCICNDFHFISFHKSYQNSFELYGADFMLTDDFLPWMLEINASPAMGASTPVTEEMCASVIEDTMKVVLDRRHDKNCDTGKFQVLFKGVSVE